jgi:hypothetical protein
MVKVFEGSKEVFFMNEYLKSNLDDAKSAVREDWDMIFLIDGYEGVGKSLMSQQCAKYCDPTFNIENIAFTPRQFRTSIMHAKPYTSIVYDEAYTGLSSRAAMTLINRTLVSMLAEIRQKNLFIFIVMPTYFDLDRYVAIWRSRALIHVYAKGFKRGTFLFFNMDKKKEMYVLGKKFYNYSKPRANFRGRFPNHYTVDKAEYLKKKKGSLIDREKKREDLAKRKEIEAELFERVMMLGDDIKHPLKMKILAMPATTYFRKLKQWRDMQESEAI